MRPPYSKALCGACQKKGYLACPIAPKLPRKRKKNVPATDRPMAPKEVITAQKIARPSHTELFVTTPLHVRKPNLPSTDMFPVTYQPLQAAHGHGNPQQFTGSQDLGTYSTESSMNPDVKGTSTFDPQIFPGHTSRTVCGGYGDYPTENLIGVLAYYFPSGLHYGTCPWVDKQFAAHGRIDGMNHSTLWVRSTHDRFHY